VRRYILVGVLSSCLYSIEHMEDDYASQNSDSETVLVADAGV
jgi:hypothetical protein